MIDCLPKDLPRLLRATRFDGAVSFVCAGDRVITEVGRVFDHLIGSVFIDLRPLPVANLSVIRINAQAYHAM